MSGNYLHQISKKTLTLAVLTALFSGGTIVSADAQEFSTPLHPCLNNNPYIEAGITNQSGRDFTFSKDTSIVVRDRNVVNWIQDSPGGSNDVNFNLGGKTLTLKATGASEDEMAGIYLQSGGKHITTTDGDLKININNSKENGSAYGLEGRAGCNAFFDIDSAIDINTTAKEKSVGLLYESAAHGRYPAMHLNGDTSIKVNKDAKEAYAIKAMGTNGVVTVNYDYKLAGQMDPSYDHQEVAVNAPTGKDVTVKIDGDVLVASGKNFIKETARVGIGLVGEDSYWHGIHNTDSHGQLNIGLKDGADWIHEKYGDHAYSKDFAQHGSVAYKVVAEKGNIHQNDANPITIRHFEGDAKVYYAHVNKGTEASDFVAGDIRIMTAKEGSALTLITDNKGIDTGNDAEVRKVLTNLAGKAVYLGAIKDVQAYDKEKEFGVFDEDAYKWKTTINRPQKNLQGKVQIASGLTSSAKWMNMADVVFSEETGRGTVAEDAVITSKAVPGASINSTYQIIEDNNYGQADRAYWTAKTFRKGEGIYDFTGMTSIKVTQPANHTLPSNNSANKPFVTRMAMVGALMWSGDTKGSINMNGYDLYLENAKTYPGVGAAGAYVTSGEVAVNNIGALNVIVDDGPVGYGLVVEGTVAIENGKGFDVGDGNARLIINNDDKVEHAVKVRVNTDKNFGSLVANGNTGSALLKITGLVDVDAHGHVVDPDIAGQTYDAIEAYNKGIIEIGGGKIIGADRSAINLYSGGEVKINAVENKDGSIEVANAERDVQVKGNIIAGGDTKAVIAMSGEGSSFRGAVDADKLDNVWRDKVTHEIVNNKYRMNSEGYWVPINTFSPETADHSWEIRSGDVSLRLDKGASWDHSIEGNKLYSNASRVKSLQSDGGIILQNADREIHIDKYQGDATLIYRHKKDTTDAKEYIGGNVKIKDVVDGSSITMITDATAVADKKTATEALGAMVNKLYFTGKVLEGDSKKVDALDVKAKIASGLTASSQILYSGKVADFAEDGMAKLSEESIKETIPGTVFTSTYQIVEDNNYGQADRAYWAANDRYDGAGNYNFTGMTTIKVTQPADHKQPTDNTANKPFVTRMGMVGALMWSGDTKGSINMNGYDLYLENVKTYPGVGAAGAYVTSGEVAVNNTGAINVIVDDGPVGYGLVVEGTVAKGGVVSEDVQKPGSGGDSGFDVGKGNARLIINNDDKVEHAVKVRVNTDKNFGSLVANGNTGSALLKITGLVDVDAHGHVVDPDVAGQTYDAIEAYNKGIIEIGGGKIIGADRSAINLYSGGEVKINAVENKDGSIEVANAERDVQIKGNIIAGGDTKAVIAMSGERSSFRGAIDADKEDLVWRDKVTHEIVNNKYRMNEDGNWELINTFSPDTADRSWEIRSGDVSLRLDKGASWDHSIEGNKLYSDASRVKSLQSDGGIILQNADREIHIDKYQGDATLIYRHKGAGADVKDYIGGNVRIKDVVKGSSITLITDNKAINGKEAAEKALSSMVKKLYFTGNVVAPEVKVMRSAFAVKAADVTRTEEKAEGLKVTAKVASGLTTSAKTLYSGSVKDFTAEGMAVLDSASVEKNESVDPVNPVDNAAETPIMKGVRSAITSTAHMWRDVAAGTFEKYDTADADGIFAEAYGGKTSYDGEGLEVDNKYKGVAVGYDKVMSNGWHAGVAIDYADGDADYLNNGSADDKAYALGVYAANKAEDGTEVAVAAKFGKVKSDFKAYNEIGTELEGDYKANAFAISASYGKRFESGNGYIKPMAKLTWARIASEDFDAVSGDDVMNVNMDAYNSLVGRLALEAGQELDKGSIYARLGVAHEFSGDIEGTYKAEEAKSTSFEGKDTWAELTVGGAYNLSENSKLYADFSKGLSGDLDYKWKVDAGLRFTF